MSTRDWPKLAAELERLLRLRALPFGMKLFAAREEMEAVPKIRRPKSVHTLDQVVAQAARLGWTVGVTGRGPGRATSAARWWGWAGRTRNGARGSTWSACGSPRSRTPAGTRLRCTWCRRESSPHSRSRRWRAGRLDPPDIALFYATPGAMIYFINGLQWAGYKRFDWSVVGESSCADSWGRALATREPSLSIPCFAERRYGGVLDDELLMALPPEQLEQALAGMQALAKNGFRYPFAQYGIQQDVRAGMAVSYPDRK